MPRGQYERKNRKVAANDERMSKPAESTGLMLKLRDGQVLTIPTKYVGEVRHALNDLSKS